MIELKRPTSIILTEPRKGIIQLSRDAQTAVSQGMLYREQLRPYVETQRALILGAEPAVFVIMGMSHQLAERVTTDLQRRQLAGLLPPSCQLLPYDVLLARFEASLPPRVVVLVPAFGRSTDDPATRHEVAALVRELCLIHLAMPLKLASGGQSREYVDGRRVLATGQALHTVADAACALLQERSIKVDAVGALSMGGGEALSHAIAVKLGISWFVVETRRTSARGGMRISGAAIGSGTRAVLIDDVVTTGAHLEAAIRATIQSGAEVIFSLAMVDRGMRVSELMRSLGISYSALCTYVDLGIDPV